MGSWKVWGSTAFIHAALLVFLYYSQGDPVKKPIRQKTAVRTVTLLSQNTTMKSALAFLDEPIEHPTFTDSIEPDSIEASQEEEHEISASEEAPLAPLQASSPRAPDPSPVKKEPSKTDTLKKLAKKTTPPPPPTVKKTKQSSLEKPKKEAPQVTKTPAVKKSSPSVPDPQKEKMMAMMKDTLAQLNKSSGTSSGSAQNKGKSGGVNSLGKIDSLGSEHLLIADAASTYQEELVAYLKHLLQLPEIGELKLRLTLTSEGKVDHLVIAYSSSDKNKLYVEKKLPSLSFPPFRGQLKEEKQHTFPITLSGY